MKALVIEPGSHTRFTDIAPPDCKEGKVPIEAQRVAAIAIDSRQRDAALVCDAECFYNSGNEDIVAALGELDEGLGKIISCGWEHMYGYK